ncbi:hypothetical protein EVAR_95092_1 [Eumeta japonica]|uniref:Uncharacterized protein n=1 Tax=Eumeta variegata TaxID=151549 RepID=A0A4C1W6V7_EUMVA|nr:hypothetical protein EVAR_95092_1 [Eumeta japonica]
MRGYGGTDYGEIRGPKATRTKLKKGDSRLLNCACGRRFAQVRCPGVGSTEILAYTPPRVGRWVVSLIEQGSEMRRLASLISIAILFRIYITIVNQYCRSIYLVRS